MSPYKYVSITCLMLLVVSFLQPISAQPTLASATFYGGSGDQYGYGITIQNGTILIGTQQAGVVRYSIPPGAPAASPTFNGYLGGLTTVGSVIYGAGNAVPPACGASDGAGDTEAKTVFARYDATSLALQGC